MRLRTVAGAVTVAVLATASAVVAQAWGDVRLTAPAPTSLVTDRYGTFITQAGHERVRLSGGRQVDYGYWPVPPPVNVVRATLALEDRHFWWHPGVDPAAVLRAAWDELTGGPRSGASTLAMQVVRMQHPRPRTIWSKTLEAVAALGITLRYGREAVLAHYLRLAPYGEGSHGIAHAARWYFDAPAAALTPAQAALLCAIPQAPGLMSLRGSRLARTQARARRAVAAMAMQADDRAAVLAELAALRPRPAPRRPADLLLAIRLREEAAGQGGGPMLRATVDLPLQGQVREAAARHLARWQRDGAQQVAVMVLRRADRSVLVDIGSAGMGTRPGGAIDFARTQRSPGSTLKPFLYALGFDRGVIAAQDVLTDLPDGSHGIDNADHDFLGPLLPRQALANSRNVPATNLLRRIGLQPAFAALRDLHLHDERGSAERFGLAMAIGALPTTLERLMRAYATLGNDGLDRGLGWFAGAQAEASRRLISLDAARLVTRFLSDPLARLPSFPRYGSSEYPFAVALKTGTSQGYRDAWTLAWSRDYLVGVWVGRADAGPMTRLSGARAAAGLAQDVLLLLHGANRTDLQAGEFAPPPGRVEAELCVATGRTEPGCNGRLSEWIRPGPALPSQSAQVPAPDLAIVRPEPNTHVWRNPNLPPGLNRLVLHATAQQGVRQIVWLLDGQPLAVAAPDAPLVWAMTPGRHRFQIRLPLQEAMSAPLTVIVE